MEQPYRIPCQDDKKFIIHKVLRGVEMGYKVVAFDMDGTLLNEDSQILPETYQAIEQLKRRGIKVLLVTGRHHTAVFPYYSQLKLDTPAICCNGTYHFDFHQQKLSEANPILPAQAQRVLELVQDFDIYSMLYLDDVMTYEKPDQRLNGFFSWVETLPRELKPELRQVPSFKSLVEQGSTVLKFSANSQHTERLTQFAAAVGAETGLNCEWSWTNHVDIAQKGNTKGASLAKWVAANGLSMQDVVAFGDNYNDISMLSSAGLGVAMGNSDQAVQDAANSVIGHNSTPAIAHKLTKIFNLSSEY